MQSPHVRSSIYHLNIFLALFTNKILDQTVKDLIRLFKTTTE